MITHERAFEIYNKHYHTSKHTAKHPDTLYFIEEDDKEMTAYFRQQEKVSKLLQLYKEKDNMTGTVRYFEILSQINDLLMELVELK